MRPLPDIARAMGIDPGALEPYGKHLAKVPLDAMPPGSPNGKLVVVTAMTPTPAGEGKTTTAIGLVDGLALLGRRPVLTLRQPSLGPVFGAKGGGTGGGLAQVAPPAEINLHCTGDAYAVAAAHNLLAAMADAAAHFGGPLGLQAAGITWRRVSSMEDRALRRVLIRSPGERDTDDGPHRETAFDIDAASEVMAVLALATGPADLRARLERIVVGSTDAGTPVTAADLRATGSMMALLRDALKPNLAQTLEGHPALIHTGPFANVAHGCSSIVADRLALACGDIVVTEAGFGAELGLEKLMHIKTRASGVMPAAVVVVVTVRAVKWHGGAAAGALALQDDAALERGLANVRHAVHVARLFGLPAVVAINRFPGDEPHELAAVARAAREAGAFSVAESHAFERGGAGAVALAREVAAATEQPAQPALLYPLDATLEQKVDTVARRVYGATGVLWDPAAREAAGRAAAQGWGHLPICMSKTHLSISADPRVRGVPADHALPVRAVRVAAGAGFVTVTAGAVQTMPGLPRDPNARRIDVDAAGAITGLA